MPSRKKRQGQARRLKKCLAKMQQGDGLQPLTTEQNDQLGEVESKMEEQFNLPGLAADMAELRELRERIKAAVRGPVD